MATDVKKLVSEMTLEETFEKIDEVNAGMYKGQKVTRAERHIDKER